METQGFDEEIRDVLEATFQAAISMGSDLTEDRIRLMIIASNLGSIASTFLLTDSNPEIKMNLKQMALGILGTQDWINEAIVREPEVL